MMRMFDRPFTIAHSRSGRLRRVERPARPARRVGRGFVWPVAALGALLVGCASGPPPDRYLLESAPVLDTRSTALALDSLGLAAVSLPGYVDDSAIVARGDGARLIVDDASQWAEAPDAAITRALAESLRLRAGANVLVEPLPRGFDPDARIEVLIDRLLGDGRGGAELAGQIRLISGDGRELLDVLPFQLRDDGGPAGPDAFFDAVSRALDDLARLIVARLGDAPA